MKTTASKENSTPSQSSNPFFNKKGEGSFLSSTKEVEQPFFSPNPGIHRNPVGSSFSGEHNFANIPTFSPRSQPAIQTKLTINEPGDKYEQEADTMAERVMRMSTPVSANGDENLVQTKPLNNTTIQRKCAACEGEEKVQRQEMEAEEHLQTKPLMRKSAEGGGYTASPQLTSQLDNSKGAGNPLPSQTLASMNEAFGANFSSVRIHTDGQAAELSQGIQAKAFTHRSDVYFNQGHYSPESSEGKRLLAHELTHVVQQGDAQSPQSAIQEQKVSPNNVIQRSPLSLTNDERIEIRRQTGNRIDRAFTAYIAAVEQNRAAIKEKARQSASFVEMIIEVAFGLAAPGLAGGIAALARRLPANASLTAYRISIAALDEAAVGRMLSASVRIGREYIRQNRFQLFGETELDQYAIVLQSQFHNAAQQIDGNLPNLTDTNLLVTYAAYDAQVTDVIHYRPIIEDILRRFGEQVQPIGPRRTMNVTDPMDRQISRQTGVMWLSHSSGPVLALVNIENGRLRFRRFIDADLKKAAIERALPLQPRGIQTIPWGLLHLPESIPANVARP